MESSWVKAIRTFKHDQKHLSEVFWGPWEVSEGHMWLLPGGPALWVLETLVCNRSVSNWWVQNLRIKRTHLITNRWRMLDHIAREGLFCMNNLLLMLAQLLAFIVWSITNIFLRCIFYVFCFFPYCSIPKYSVCAGYYSGGPEFVIPECSFAYWVYFWISQTMVPECSVHLFKHSSWLN